jgi:tetratricopeptide (TPR) repeat protein
MDLQQRLSSLENHQDWYGLAEALNQALLDVTDNASKAELHLRLGRVLHTQFLHGVKALKHFQDAYKLNPSLTVALAEARAVYGELGKLNMVQKLVELQLKVATEPSESARLARDLGDVLCDEGQYERAVAAYASALEQLGGTDPELSELLADAQTTPEQWQDRLAAILRHAHATSDAAAKSYEFTRAARIARRYAPDEAEGMLTQAYTFDFRNASAAALLENLLVESGRTEAILRIQLSAVEAIEEPFKLQAFMTFGARWALRHQNVEVAGQFLLEAFRRDPSLVQSLIYLREHSEQWPAGFSGLLAVVDATLEARGYAPEMRGTLAVAGVIAWQELNDVERAKAYLRPLALLDPENPTTIAFRGQVGPLETSKTEMTEVPVSLTESLEQTKGEPTPVAASESESYAASAYQADEPVAVAPPENVMPAEQVRVENEEKINALREQLHQQEEGKRFSELVKTLMALGDELADPLERAELYMRAADLYVSKFVNQAEAVRAYEKVVECDPMNPVALDYLRQMYEKRRDWEKLVALSLAQAREVEPGPERTSLFKDIAKLATERIKKPEVCIDLWNEVLSSDPSDVEALSALAQLYERGRDFVRLAQVLEQLVEVTFESKEKIQLLNKLAQVVGDRLNDDARAVAAYQALLALVPDDRRAQEQLKKRYVTLGRWDDLEVFYAESGKWDEFIRILESNEAKTEDVAQRVAMLLKIAELWTTQKGKTDRAVRSYEKVLQLDPNNLAAAVRLAPLYSAANNSKGLASVIEIQLAHAEDRLDRLPLLRDVATLYERNLKDSALAFERYLEAFEIAPTEEQGQDDVERVARSANSWPRVVEAYRSAVAALASDGDFNAVVALRLRLGRVFVDEMNSLDDALAEYRAVYDEDSENQAALTALEQLYQQTQRWSDLLQVYTRKMEIAASEEEQRAVQYDIARLYEVHMGDVQAAVQTYQGILDQDPADSASLEALDRLYGATENWTQLAEVLEKRIELDVDEATLIDLKFRLAQAQLQHLHQDSDALANYREILLMSADHQGARLALEGLLRHPNLRTEAAGILEAIYEGREDWEKLIETLDILAESIEDPERRVELLRKMAETAASRLGRPDRAVESLARALIEDPAQKDTRIELEGCVEQSGAWSRLMEVYQKIASDLSDIDLAREYWLRLAEIQEQQQLVDEAAASYDQVLTLDPGDSSALGALDSLYRRTERWEQLVGVYRRRIELEPDSDASENLYGQMAQVLEEKLNRPGEAISAYREVLGIDPGNPNALLALDGLFTRQELWEDLAENLELQMNLADSDEAQIQIMLRLASLRERKMDQVESAIDGYRQVLERDPANVEALGALERLGQVPEYQLTVAEILEPLYEERGDFRKLIGVYEVQVTCADDAHRKVELLHRIAELYEDAGSDPNAAFDTFARALRLDASNDETQATIARLAQATQRFGDLAEVLESLASSQDDVELASQLTASAAGIYEREVGNVDKAIELYRRVLEIDPVNIEAAEALQTLYQATERFGDMSRILQRKAEILDSSEDQKAALYEAARIEEEILDRKDNSISVFLKVLDVDPEDLTSVDSLIRLYLSLSRWQELLGMYIRKIDLLIDPEEKKLIYYQVGAVYERELGDVQQAIDTYQKVLEIDPDDVEALGRLDVLYQTAENWQELLSVLTHESELAGDPTESVGYQFRIAELYERKLGDIERAVELYRDILSIQTDHEPTLRALEGIKDGKEAPIAAAAVLEPIYDSLGDWPKLISVLEVQAKFSEVPYEKVELIHRIARLYEENLGRHVEAFQTYARALSLDSQNEETLSSLERLASVTERWPLLASLYDAEVQKLSDDPSLRVELGLRVAQVYEVQLENIDEAIQRYRDVLEVEPENQFALRALDKLYGLSERWTELATILEREAETAETPDEILEFKFRLGQVNQVRLGNVAAALDAYQEVINVAPEHAETLTALESLFASGVEQAKVCEILEPLYQSSAEWEKLLQVHEAQLASAREQDDRLAMYYRLIEDAEERLGDSVLAFSVSVRGLKEYPLDEKIGEETERFAAGNDGGWDQLANAYADVLGAETTTPEIQATIGKRLARVFEEELGDVTKAEETYRYVLTSVPQEPEVLENLDRIYTTLGQWTELAAILEQRATATDDARERVGFYLRLGELYEEQLNLIEDAIRAYKKIFDELEPTNEETVAALARIYANTENWSDLKRVHLRELDNAVGDVQEAEVRARLARLASDRLGNIDEAVEGWKRVLDLRGEDAEALWALADLYQKQSRWAELTDVLERNFDIADSDDERVNILSRRARLFLEQLSREDEALETWNRVLDIDFANVPALRAVASIWRQKNDAQELVSALHAIIDRASGAIESEELVAVYRELGKTYGQRLEQRYEAADAWRHLLEVDPSDFEAMNELESIYRGDEQWVDIIGIKMQRAEALPTEEEKVRELLEVTELWKVQVGDYDKATVAFDKILAVDPKHVEAFEALEALHSAAGRWESLIELYLNRLETREEVQERSDLLRRIAKIFEENLADNNQAFDALVNAFSEDYKDDETAKYLERIAQATNRWGELLSTANAWLTETTDPDEKIALCLRLGKWYGQDLGHPEWAQPYYQQIMQLDPNNVQVLRQIAAIHRVGGNWQKVGETLQRARTVAVSNDDRKAILVDMGELLERNMGQLEAGLSHYRQALDVDPLYLPALEALERIYESQDDVPQLVEILTSKVQALTDSEQIAKHKLRIAQLYESSLKNLEKAGSTYREVLAIDPGNITALRGLERIDELTQNWADLVQVLEKQLDVLETERERVEVLLKVAGVQEEQFFRVDVAAQRLESALEIDPSEERAYVALERCYRRLKQWLDLINTFERHVAEVVGAQDKIDIYAQIAQVFADEVGDVDRAIDAYRNIVDLNDAHVPALEALAKLYEKQGDAQQSIEAMSRVAELTDDGKQRVEMYYRIGKAMEEQLGDRPQAQERFEMALDLDPAHLPTLAALRAIAADESDWDRAARYLNEEQINTQAPRARAKLLVELGRLRDEMLSEHESAIEAYALAMQCDDDCEEAALPLVEEYIRTERWTDAEPLAELLVRKAKAKDRHEQHMLYKILGKVHAALGNWDKALKAYQTAHQLDLTDQEAIRGIADAAFALRDWPSALTNYQKVLTALEEGDVAERTDVYYRLGCIKREQGQTRQAINNFEKALALQQDHRPTLDALIEIYVKNNDWKQVAAYKRQILDGLFDTEPRLELLIEIGDIWADHEKNWKKAIEALEEALELSPSDHIILHKLLQLYQKAGDWSKMIEVLQKIAELESRGEIRARYIFTQAQLYRDKLNEPERAVELFNEALDLNPSYLEAFERINKILTQTKNWQQLERAYRKMLHRVAGKGNTELEYTLWHQLGLIYRDRQQQIPEAIEAFNMAAVANPESLVEHQILAELYESAEQWDEAIEQTRKVIAADPLKVDAYRNLYRLFLFKRAYDEAWCVASVMVFLGEANEEEKRFYEDYKPQGMLMPRGRLTENLWRNNLLHAEAKNHISSIFQMLVPAARAAKGMELKASGKLQGLDPRFKQDPATSTVTFAKTFFWAVQVLGTIVPELYVRTDVAAGITAVPSDPPASIAGQAVLSGFQPSELAFICAKHLSGYRGESYIRALFPTQSELTIMFFAGVYLAAPSTPLPQEIAPLVQRSAQALVKFMDAVQGEHLRAAVKQWMADGSTANIRRWTQGIELTACRAALLVCGDLEIAKHILAAESTLPGDLSPADKMKELLLFSVSDDYSTLRQALGVTISVEE